jgi:hypothetical protein
MQTRRLYEGLIGFMALGKAVELGRQLALVADNKLAEKQAQSLGVQPQSLQTWGNGYVALDAVISVTGILGMIQAIRKNRKGAGKTILVQGGAALAYSLYYLFYTLFALKGAKGSARLINFAFVAGHAIAGVLIYRFAQRALQ